MADRANGYALTLPAGWAQIDLGTGAIVVTASTPTVAPETAALVKRVAATLKAANYEGMAADVASSSNGSAMPSMLGIDLSPAKGVTLDSIASQELTAAQGGAGQPQQGRLTMAGLPTVWTRFSGTQADLHAKDVKVVLTNYVTVVGDQAFGLYFLVDPLNDPTDAAVLEAMAHSLEIPDRVECTGPS
jgi:hypothetical protein